MEVNNYMTHIENIIFTIIFTAAILAFLYSFIRLTRIILLGKNDDRLKGTFLKRFNTMIYYAFFQKRVISTGYGWNHLVIFWGFIILVFANVEFIFSGLFPGISYRTLLPYAWIEYVYTVFDIGSIVVLASITLAMIRRIIIRPKHIEAMSRDAFIILGLISGLMVAYFGMQGSEIALGKITGSVFMPASGIIGSLFSGMDSGTVKILYHSFWWLHAVIFLSFLNYLPHSKHMHILAAIPNCYCRSFEFVTTVPREKFRAGKLNGVSAFDQFSWKDLLDFAACTECGRCNKNCPATITNKTLNPRIMIHQGKENMLANGMKFLNGNKTEGITPLIIFGEGEASVNEKILWDCTTCGACMENCPVFIEHVPKIIKMRRHFVQNKAKFPEELVVFFEAIEQRSNPWGIAPSDRGKWANDLNIPSYTKDGNYEYLLYAGCAGSFDSRIKKVSTAVARLLKAANVSFAVLGQDELCCGDSLRRLGNEYIFEKMAARNVEKFNGLGVKKIITLCPHCFSTLKNDYAQYGLNAEVLHHTELLNTLMDSGSLKLTGKTDNSKRIVFHDSCYLGRYNNIYKEPRELIEKATGKKAIELDRKYEKSFCCGAGGGRMWMEEEPDKRININRTKEALDKNPDQIAVACPYCLTMFVDGVKDMKVLESVQVMDVAEILSERIESA